MNYIIYHRKRDISDIGNCRIYHDSYYQGNQDPYIWNTQFLHSFCHITQIQPEIGSKIFWVSSGDKYPDFNSLNCDCVFVVEEKKHWKNTNSISIDDPIVDNNEQAFNHHYCWYHQHPLKKRKRYTLKANKEQSFQPQDKNQNLIDIVPLLTNNGLLIDDLRKAISKTRNGKRAVNSRTFKLSNELADKLYEYLLSADIKIKGEMIMDKHPYKQNKIEIHNKKCRC